HEADHKHAAQQQTGKGKQVEDAAQPLPALALWIVKDLLVHRETRATRRMQLCPSYAVDWPESTRGAEASRSASMMQRHGRTTVENRYLHRACTRGWARAASLVCRPSFPRERRHADLRKHRAQLDAAWLLWVYCAARRSGADADPSPWLSAVSHGLFRDLRG